MIINNIDNTQIPMRNHQRTLRWKTLKRVKTLAENETYKYLGILEADAIKQEEMKEKNLKRIFQEN